MTTEPTQPQPEQGPAPDNGQVQSHGHRRRRRRRKNKSSQQAGMQQPQQSAGAPQMQSPKRRRKPLRRSRSSASESQEEEILPKARGSRRTSPATASQGLRRASARDRQKGPRTFVGPMDHSYRAVNGNVADGPPSTIPTASNGHSSGYYPDAYSAQPPRAGPRRRAHTHLLLH